MLRTFIAVGIDKSRYVTMRALLSSLWTHCTFLSKVRLLQSLESLLQPLQRTPRNWPRQVSITGSMTGAKSYSVRGREILMQQSSHSFSLSVAETPGSTAVESVTAVHRGFSLLHFMGSKLS